MRSPRRLAAAALLGASLLGCARAEDDGAGGGGRGRYAGAGVYPAGRMWSQMAVAKAGADPASARLGDDEQVIVTVDSRTGELRQCGNLSGYCVRSDPWTAAPSAVRLRRHADELDREAAGPRPNP